MSFILDSVFRPLNSPRFASFARKIRENLRPKKIFRLTSSIPDIYFSMTSVLRTAAENKEKKMNPESLIILCPQCGAKNRLPKDQWGAPAVCGKCRAPLPFSNPFPDHPVEVSDRTFQNEVLDFSGPVLLEFFAPWCSHCQRLSPVLDQLASEYAGRAKVAKLNIDENSLTPSQYAVRGVPTMLFFKGGRPMNRLVGDQPKGEIERQLNSIL
jgi:thioredoxin 2